MKEKKSARETLIYFFHMETVSEPNTNEPRHEKTCLGGLRPGKTQTDLLSYRDELESCNFGYSKYRYYTT